MRKVEGRYIDYSNGWLRIGRRWFGFYKRRPYILPVIQGGTSANTTQEDFWFRNDDGSLTTATYKGSQNDNWAPTVTANVKFRLRIIAQENNGKNDPWAFQLYVEKNSGGTPTALTTTRNDGVRYADDANSIADGTTISTADFDLTYTGTAQNGEYDDAQSSVGTSTISLNGTYTEIEFCGELVLADLQNGDYFDFYLYSTGGTPLDGQTYVPRITVTVQATVAGSATLDGSSTLAAAGSVLLGASSTLAGAATLSGHPSLLHQASAQLDGSSTCSGYPTTTQGETHTAQALLDGSSTLAGVPSLLHQVSAQLDASATVTADGSQILVSASQLDGSSSVAAQASVTYGGFAQLDGIATLTAVGTLLGQVTGAAVLNGSSTLVGDGAVTYGGAALLEGSATVTAVGSLLGTVTGAAVLNGTSLLTANGVRIVIGTSSLDGVATVAAAPVLFLGGQAVLQGTTSVAAIGTVVPAGGITHEAQALLIGVATLTATARQIIISDTPFGGPVWITREIKVPVQITLDTGREVDL